MSEGISSIYTLGLGSLMVLNLQGSYLTSVPGPEPVEQPLSEEHSLTQQDGLEHKRRYQGPLTDVSWDVCERHLSLGP